MALAKTVTDIGAGGALGIRAMGTLVPSGNYTTGGDTLDFRDDSRLVRKDPRHVRIHGIKGYMYSYDFVNRKMLVHTTANTELPGAPTAYPAGVLADLIRFEVWFTK